MKSILIGLIALLLIGCTGLVVKTHGQDVRLQRLEKRIEVLNKSLECLNNDGQFDEDMGDEIVHCGDL